MKGSFKVGGGLNPMHLTNTNDPFGPIGTQKNGQTSIDGTGVFGGKSTVKFAHMKGLSPNPAGGGDKISANASMRKGKVGGSGEAR